MSDQLFPANGVPANPRIPGNKGMIVPKGSTAERRDPANEAEFRFNDETGHYEGFDGSVWRIIATSGTPGLGDLLADGSVPMTDNFDFGGFKGVNAADPENDQDVSTKKWTIDWFTDNLPTVKAYGPPQAIMSRPADGLESFFQGPDGVLYSSQAGTVFQYALDGSLSDSFALTGVTNIYSGAGGSDGNLWLSVKHSGVYKICKVATDGSGATYYTSTNLLNGASSAVLGADNKVYFASSTNGYVFKVATDGTITELVTTNPPFTVAN